MNDDTQSINTKTLPKIRGRRLKPRDISKAAQHSRNYTRLVGWLRWALPLVVILGLGLLVLWPYVRSMGLEAVVIQKVPNLMIEKLNLTGLDHKNQPYALTAVRAMQVGNLKNLIDLESPKGELTLTDGGWLSGGGDHGRFDQKEEKLWLGGNVEFFHDKGYRFVTEEIFVDIKKNTAWTDKKASFQGPFGRIQGANFRALEGGGTIIFGGPAKARLHIK
ncbi:MAG: LPS export ABC transporter periplasmic protein LptC [Bdellovibrionales bacterium]